MALKVLSIAALTLVASLVGTMTGFGIATIMTSVLALFLPPIEVLLLVAIVHWFGDVWKIGLFRSGFRLRLVAMFGLTGVVASFLGARVTLGLSPGLLLRVLGAFLIVYAVFLMVQSGFRVAPSAAVALAGGSLSGFTAGIFGVGGAIRSAFLSLFDLPKDVYIATSGAIGLLVDSSRIVTYFAGGARLEHAFVWGLLVFIPASFAGAALARRIVDRIPQARFRMVIAVFLLAAGLKLAIRPH
jgi:uncharacterized membrane protein YfcA